MWATKLPLYNPKQSFDLISTLNSSLHTLFCFLIYINIIIYLSLDKIIKIVYNNLLRVIDMKLLNIGFGNSVVADRIVSIINPDSAPVRRLIQDAKDRGILIDATCGRKTRAVIISDSGHIILSGLQTDTVNSRAEAE